MRALLLGKHKRSAVGALDYLVDRGVEVVGVVAPSDPGSAAGAQRLDVAARRHRVPVTTDDEVYACLEDPSAGSLRLDGVDVVLSFLFWRRMRRPIIELGRVGCLNFHPAPLPDFRGLGGYNVALMEGLTAWGASAHFVDDELDTGDLVRVDRFPIDPEVETALSLDITTQLRLLLLFRDVIDQLLAGEELPRSPQQAEGRYIDRPTVEALRHVRPGDRAELTARRIRAFWYPPYPGATLELDGQSFTLVDDRILQETTRFNQAAGVMA